MTTPRKAWFRVPDSILHETPHEHRGTVVSLVAVMNQRWARDGLTAEQASTISLGKTELTVITGRDRLAYSVPALRQSLASTEAALTQHGASVTVEWPKVAEFQGWTARERTDERPLRDAPAPAPASKREGPPSGDPPTLETSGDPERWVNMLPETDRERALPWLIENLALVEAEASASFADKEPTKRALTDKTRALIFRFWNQHKRNPNGPPVQGRPVQTAPRIPLYVPPTAEPQSAEQKAATAAARREALAAVRRGVKSTTPEYAK